MERSKSLIIVMIGVNNQKSCGLVKMGQKIWMLVMLNHLIKRYNLIFINLGAAYVSNLHCDQMSEDELRNTLTEACTDRKSFVMKIAGPCEFESSFLTTLNNNNDEEGEDEEGRRGTTTTALADSTRREGIMDDDIDSA